MKWAALAAMLAGLALAGALIVHFGAGDIATAVSTAGWGGLAAISALHLCLMGVMGLGWWMLVRGGRDRPQPVTFIWGRLLRDAGSEVLPLSQVGGYVLGARALILQGISGTVAAASTVVDVTLELLAQIVFTALGVGFLLWLKPGTGFALPVLAGLGIAVAAAAGFIFVQRRHASILDRVATHIAQGWLTAIATRGEAVQDEIRQIYRRQTGTRAGFVLHLVAWIASVGEPWLALQFMGSPLGFGELLAIESLVYAGRSVAFFVPNAFGVQEGAYIVLGGLFGLTPELALALSLLKRGRDLVLGIPTLLLWQALEGRRWWLRRPAASVPRDLGGSP